MAKATSVRGVKTLGGGLYAIRVTFVDPKSGKEQNRVRRVKAASVGDAARIRAELRAEEVAGRSPRARARQRFGESISSWLAQKRPSLRASTRAMYRVQVGAWVEALGEDTWLDAIEPEDVGAALASWSAAGLSADTCNGRLRCLRTFAKEVRARAIVDNVHALAKPAGPKKPRGLTMAELRVLLARGEREWRAVATTKTAKGTRYERHVGYWWPLLATLAWTGMRFSEAIALEWTDHDLADKMLVIERGHVRNETSEPKTEAGYRGVPVPAPLAAVLAEHRKRLMRAGAPMRLLFPSPDGGGIVSNTGARKAILTLMKDAGVERGKRPALHCLRHTWNNQVRQVTSELVRRRIVGHAGDEAGAIYSDVEAREAHAAAAKVVARIGGRR